MFTDFHETFFPFIFATDGTAGFEARLDLRVPPCLECVPVQCTVSGKNKWEKHFVDVRGRASTCVDVRPRTSTYVDVRRRTSRTSTHVDVRRRTST